ncbi:MAG: UDP-N-acetylmuramoyl-tripeptide--D-alanyl-D-alanine ligase [Clostridia bacterium]|nr:UDP-N-acetylmuramoyl-tripeptide--D-alanyl-D-alanine ligase [Clostridia bacterium]
MIKNIYIKKAKKRLQQVGCKVIAITGSFGKTSVKNILYELLKEQFQVCATPKSFNTPMGICKTILGNLKDFDEYLIVEYGARHKGDIEFLAKTFGVDFALITPIGNCHLETFGSLENIVNTKFELCQEAKDVVVFNGKSRQTKKLYERHKLKKFLVCEENSFAYAKDINISERGANFVLYIDGNQVQCETNLLGMVNIDNVVQASAMAYILGESLFDIKNAIKKLKPTPHRLELIKGENVKIIDDSFNSNIEGFMQALEILTKFDGQKVVVSPGMVELGKEQFEVNFRAGVMIGKVADVFILMNESNKKAMFEGALKGGMDKSKIYFANSRNEQKILLKNLLQKGAVVLFENDLPDNFK